MHAVLVKEGEEVRPFRLVAGGEHILGVDEDSNDAHQLHGAPHLRVAVNHHLLQHDVQQVLLLQHKLSNEPRLSDTLNAAIDGCF